MLSMKMRINNSDTAKLNRKRAAEILNEFRRRRYSMGQFAQDYGCQTSNVSQVFAGKMTSEPLMRTAATLVNVFKRLERRAAGL